MILTMVFPFALASGPMASADSKVEDSCRVQKIDETSESSLTYLKIGERKIAIIGWSHPSPLPRFDQYTSSHFSSAVEAAKKNKCAVAKEELQELLLARSENLTNSRGLTSRFETVQKEFAIDVIALEHSPASWSQTKEALDSYSENLLFTGKKCPAEISPIVSNLSAIYPGPEYKFMQANPNIKLQPVEDERIRDQASSLVHELSDLPELSFADMTEKARILYRPLLEKFDKAVIVTDEERAQVLAAQGKGEVAVILGNYIDIFNRISGLTIWRDSRIADNILEGSGNYVMAIGNSHADDLVRQLKGKCQLRIFARAYPGAEKVSETLSTTGR
ncbi:MAG: hypothetical protein ACXVA9_04930 [Bdellovibrionales bacterium]